MNKIDIEQIERELDILLPESYKIVVLNHPFVDKNKYHSVHEALLDSTAEIIDINTKLRSEGIQGKKWKKIFLL